MLKKNLPANPDVVALSRMLFFLIGGIWLLFGAAWLIRGTELSAGFQWADWIMPALVLANAFLLLIPGFALRPGQKLVYYYGVMILVVNILLTFTDEFGFFDFATLLIDILLVTLLVRGRTRFLSRDQKSTGA